MKKTITFERKDFPMDGINEIENELKGVISLRDSVEKMQRATCEVRSGKSLDVDIERLRRINEININYNRQLEEAKQSLEAHISLLSKTLATISNVFNSARTEIEIPKKPRLWPLALTLTIIATLMTLGSTLFPEAKWFVIIGFSLIASVISTSLGIIYRDDRKIYKDFDEPSLIVSNQTKFKTRLSQKVEKATEEVSVFHKTNADSIFDHKKLDTINQEYDKAVQSYDDLWKYVQDPKLLVQCLEIVEYKRAKTFQEAINIAFEMGRNK